MAADPNDLSTQLRTLIDRSRAGWQAEIRAKTAQLAETNQKAQELQNRIAVLQSWIDGTDASTDVVVPSASKVAALGRSQAP